MKNILFLAAFFLTSLSAFAGPFDIEGLGAPFAMSQQTYDHLTITSVEVTDLTSEYAYLDDPFDAYRYMEPVNKNVPNSLSGVISNLTLVDVIVDKIINIGQKIWNVVEKGRPVTTYTKQTGSALPANTLRWDQLQNWQHPKSKVIGITYKNVYGAQVVKFVYRIVMLYGGNVQGVGRYIGYAAVEPVEMTTAYLYNFDAEARIDAVYNMGTSANPVAGMLLNVGWTVKTVLKNMTQNQTYTLDGNGNISVPTETLTITETK